MVKKILNKKKTNSLKPKDEEIQIKNDEKQNVSESLNSEIQLETFEEEYSGLSVVHNKKVLSRTESLVLDYKQFKAARTIQKWARAWYAHRIYLRKRQAAITIQRFWRGFYAKRSYFRYLEEELQRRIVKHLNDSATSIQKVWRGHYVRTHVHDHYRLLRDQVRSAEELLHCVAYKLHYLLRTHQIPGVYSLRHTSALSKVEKLLVALSFKLHNQQINKAQKRFDEASVQSSLPLRNYGPKLDPKCKELYRQKDSDVRMHRILSMYQNKEKNQRVSHGHVSREPKRESVDKPNKRQKMNVGEEEEPKTTFCEDVVNSLHRWRILGPKKTKINPDIFKTPFSIEGFISEISSIYERMINDPCVCMTRYVQ